MAKAARRVDGDGAVAPRREYTALTHSRRACSDSDRFSVSTHTAEAVSEVGEGSRAVKGVCVRFAT